MRQMKEQQERNRAAECRRNREIASLKKDQRRAEVARISYLKRCLLTNLNSNLNLVMSFPVFIMIISSSSTN